MYTNVYEVTIYFVRSSSYPRRRMVNVPCRAGVMKVHLVHLSIVSLALVP